MATTVYVPGDPRAGMLGEGVGMALGGYLGKKKVDEEEQKNLELVSRFKRDIQQAGTRDKALEVTTRPEYAPLLQDIEDHKIAGTLIAQLYGDASTESLGDVDIFNESGDKQTIYMSETQKKEASTTDKTLTEIMGKNLEGWSTIEPEKEDDPFEYELFNSMNEFVGKGTIEEARAGNLTPKPELVETRARERAEREKKKAGKVGTDKEVEMEAKANLKRFDREETPENINDEVRIIRNREKVKRNIAVAMGGSLEQGIYSGISNDEKDPLIFERASEIAEFLLRDGFVNTGRVARLSREAAEAIVKNSRGRVEKFPVNRERRKENTLYFEDGVIFLYDKKTNEKIILE